MIVFEDRDGIQGYVDIEDGSFVGTYNGQYDALHRLLHRADTYEVPADGTRAVKVTEPGEDVSDVFANVAPVENNMKAAAATEKYEFVRRELDHIDPVVAFHEQ